MSPSFVMVLCFLAPSLGYFFYYLLKKRKQTHTLSANVSLISITFALVATEFGGELVLGTSEEAYASGLFGLLYIGGISLGFLLLGFGFAAKMKALNVSSSIEIFSIKYHSPTLKKIASILSLLTVMGLLFGQAIACKTLLASLGINQPLIVIGFWLLTCIYAITGGLSAAGMTNLFQIAYVLTTFTGIFVYCIVKEPPSFFALKTFLDTQILFNSSSYSLSALFTSLIMPALYCIIEQDYAQPLFAARTKRTALFSAIGASLFMLLFSLVPLYFGIKAKLLNITTEQGASPLIAVLHIMTNNSIVIMAICGIIAAIIATTNYLLWSVTNSLSEYFACKESEKVTKVQIERIIACILGCGIVITSYLANWSSLSVLSCSFELYDCCLVVPLIMTYFKQELRKGAAIGSLSAGLLGFILFRIMPISFPKEIASLLLSMIGYILGEWIERLWQRFMASRRTRALFRVG